MPVLGLGPMASHRPGAFGVNPTAKVGADLSIDLVSRSGPTEKMAPVRRLTAMLAADVAGYSRLMGADEEGTHERLKKHLGELVNPKIKEHRGRIVKTPATASWRNL